MDHRNRQLPPLDSLRAFEAAARLGSFSAAAEHLNVTHGAISRRIAGLEQWLDQRLFRRGSKGVTLTPDGDRLFARTTQAFDLLSEGSDRWQDVRRGSVVRVTSLRAVCSCWLIPHLAELEKGDPKIRVDIVVDDSRPMDMEEFALDLAIRVGAGGTPGRTSLKLLDDTCFPIARPDIADKIVGKDVGHLLDFPLLHNRDATLWRSWLRQFDIPYRPRLEDRRLSDYGLVIDAAIEGLGIALGRPLLTREPLETGKLVRVGNSVAASPHPYFLDRPIGPVRSAAASVARRIATLFAVPDAEIEGFLEPDRMAASRLVSADKGGVLP